MQRRDFLALLPLPLLGFRKGEKLREQLGSKTVTLNSSGNGTAVLGPTFSSELWHVTSTAVTTSTANKHPICRTFIGAAFAGNQLDATPTGDDDSSDTVFDLVAGQVLTAQWLAGDSGAQATVTLYGEKRSR